uniref:Putative secreted protein n=1 Tax=Anopheles triannulatus TaxID=58253 RepID=A0A2M4B576_9DIPT
MRRPRPAVSRAIAMATVMWRSGCAMRRRASATARITPRGYGVRCAIGTFTVNRRMVASVITSVLRAAC